MTQINVVQDQHEISMVAMVAPSMQGSVMINNGNLSAGMSQHVISGNVDNHDNCHQVCAGQLAIHVSRQRRNASDW